MNFVNLVSGLVFQSSCQVEETGEDERNGRREQQQFQGKLRKGIYQNLTI
jgi:hypothetical protein